MHVLRREWAGTTVCESLHVWGTGRMRIASVRCKRNGGTYETNLTKEHLQDPTQHIDACKRPKRRLAREVKCMVHGASPLASGVPAEDACRTIRGLVPIGHVPSHNLTLERNQASSVGGRARPSSSLLRSTSACFRFVVHLPCIRATPFPSLQCDGRACVGVLPPKRISHPIDGESRPSNADRTVRMAPPRREKTLHVRVRRPSHRIRFTTLFSPRILRGRSWKAIHSQLCFSVRRGSRRSQPHVSTQFRLAPLARRARQQRRTFQPTSGRQGTVER